MKQELVEKVAEQMIAWDQTDISPDSQYVVLARYAIALAERAAEEAVREYRTGSMANPVEPAVERAVEGA